MVDIFNWDRQGIKFDTVIACMVAYELENLVYENNIPNVSLIPIVRSIRTLIINEPTDNLKFRGFAAILKKYARLEDEKEK